MSNIPERWKEWHALCGSSTTCKLIEELGQAEADNAELKAAMPDDNDPLLIPQIKCGTFDPEISKQRQEGTIGDWIRRAKKSEAERDAAILAEQAMEKRVIDLEAALIRVINDFEMDYVVDGIVVDDPPKPWIDTYNIARTALKPASDLREKEK